MLGDLQESFRHGEDAPIAFMDVEAHLVNKAKMMCNMWDEEGRENGAISEMATEAVWRRIPSNIIPPPSGSPPGALSTYHPRPTYPRPQRTASDNPATRDMHDEATEKRKDFLAARAALKSELMKIIGEDIAETMAADQLDGSLSSMSCVDMMEWLESRYGRLSSTHVKKLISELQTRCDQAADFPKHCARFNRSIRRLNRAQLRLDNAYTIVPTSQTLYQYLLESIAHIPQFTLLISQFGTSHPTMAQQTHSSLQQYLTNNLDFAQNFAATEGFIGLFSQSTSSSVPPPPSHPAHKISGKEGEEERA